MATLMIFLALGIAIGIALANILYRGMDQGQIEEALDTIGIRRKEFLKVVAEVDSLTRTVSVNSDRILYLEKNVAELIRHGQQSMEP